MIKKFLNWLVFSSANPEAISLTVRGFLLANIGTIIFILQMFQVSWSVDYTTELIQAISVAFGSAIALIGLFRKIYFMVKKGE